MPEHEDMPAAPPPRPPPPSPTSRGPSSEVSVPGDGTVAPAPPPQLPSPRARGGGGGGTQVTSTGQQVPARYRPTSRDRSDIREEYDLLTEDDKALSRTFHIRLRGTRLRQRRKES